MLIAVAVSDGALIVAAGLGTGVLGAVITPGNIFILAGDYAAFSGIWLFLHIVVLIAIAVADSAFIVTSGFSASMLGAEITSRSAAVFT